MNTQLRSLEARYSARPASDGDGVLMHRVAGSQLHAFMDPFLLLDEIQSDDSADYIGGFPDHPHRGFETVTYMQRGKMRHRDHLGNEGLLEDGDVQWMTAGRGVIHSEMPEQSQGALHGFQLWLNLPAKDKLKPASYQDFRAEQLPVVELPNVGQVKLISGSIADPDGNGQIEGPVQGGSTRPLYYDIHLRADGIWTVEVPDRHTALIYVYEGSTNELSRRDLGIYTQGNAVEIKAGTEGVKALLLAAEPIGEPVVQYGPFVMNTSSEIEQAIRDYRQGQLTA